MDKIKYISIDEFKKSKVKMNEVAIVGNEFYIGYIKIGKNLISKKDFKELLAAKSYRKIGEMFGVSRTSVFNAAKSIGVEKQRPKTKFDQISDNLKEEVVRGDVTAKELASKYGVSISSMTRYLKKLGVNIPKGRKRKVVDFDSFSNPYISYRKMADALKVSKSTVYNYARRYNLARKRGRKPSVLLPFGIEYIRKKRGEGFNFKQIATLMGLSLTTIYKYKRKYKIK